MNEEEILLILDAMDDCTFRAMENTDLISSLLKIENSITISTPKSFKSKQGDGLVFRFWNDSDKIVAKKVRMILEVISASDFKCYASLHVPTDWKRYDNVVLYSYLSKVKYLWIGGYKFVWENDELLLDTGLHTELKE